MAKRKREEEVLFLVLAFSCDPSLFGRNFPLSLLVVCNFAIS